MIVLCIVKIPDKVCSKTKDLYHRAATHVYHTLSGMGDRIERLVAVGPDEYRSFWPGENWASTPRDSDTIFLNTDMKKILLVGLDAPFLSKKTIDAFFTSSLTNTATVEPERCLCTFRKTPTQKNPAALMHCGDAIVNVQNNRETLTASVRKTSGETHPYEQDFSVAFSEDRVSISSSTGLNFMYSQPTSSTCCYLNKESLRDGGLTEKIHYSENNGKHTIIFSGDCTLHVLKGINSPGLFRNIHFMSTPITISDVIGTDCNQNRINLDSGEIISGRQSFPEIYEPFFGMIAAEATTIRQMLLEGDAWLGNQEKLTSFIVPEKESDLISENSLAVRAGIVSPNFSGSMV